MPIIIKALVIPVRSRLSHFTLVHGDQRAQRQERIGQDDAGELV
jgi:hypothetical protein